MAYNEDDEYANSGGLFDQNRSLTKSNKIAGIKNYVDQNQSQQGANTVATKVKQADNVNKNMSKTQQDKTGYVVQTGEGINKQVQDGTWNSGVKIRTVAPNKTQGNPIEDVKNNFSNVNFSEGGFDVNNINKDIGVGTSGTYVNPAFESSAQAATLKDSLARLTAKAAELKAAITAQGANIDKTATEDLAAMTAQIKIIRDKLGTYSTSSDVADIGAMNNYESTNANITDGLNNGMGNIGYLQNMFGGNYDSGTFGALDSQIYNGDINQARDLSEAAGIQTKKDQAEKGAGVKSYLNAIKKGNTDIDNFATDFTNAVGRNKFDQKSTFKDQEKGIDDAVAKQSKFLESDARNIQKVVTQRPKDANSAKKVLGDDFDRYAKIFSKPLDDGPNGDPEGYRHQYEPSPDDTTSSTYTPDWNGESKNRPKPVTTQTPIEGSGMRRDLAQVSAALARDPNNSLLQYFKKAIESKIRNVQKDANEAQWKADYDQRQAEELAKKNAPAPEKPKRSSKYNKE